MSINEVLPSVSIDAVGRSRYIHVCLIYWWSKFTVAFVFLYEATNNEKSIFRASGNDKATIERPQKRQLTQLVVLVLNQRLIYFVCKVMVRDGPLNFHFSSHFSC